MTAVLEVREWSAGRPDICVYTRIKVKWSRYRDCVAQRVGTGIALLFHDRGIRRGWVVSSTPRPHFTPGKDTVPFLQEAGWVPGPVWTGGKSRPQRDSIPDRPARSQSLYRLSYLAHLYIPIHMKSINICRFEIYKCLQCEIYKYMCYEIYKCLQKWNL